jgi:hypothetical protein
MIVTLVAPEVAQFSVVLLPAVIAEGLAEKDEMTGVGICGVVGVGCVQLVSAVQPRKPANRMSPRARAPAFDSLRSLKFKLPFGSGQGESMRSLSIDCHLPPVGSIG